MCYAYKANKSKQIYEKEEWTMRLHIPSGLHRVPEQERWLIERSGRFSRILLPGLNWISPLDSVKAKVDVREQQIQLFAKSARFDFRDGGSATPKEVYVFVKIVDPYKTIYEIQDWEKAVVSLMENTLRIYLSGMTVEEGLTMGRLGYNLLGKDPAGQEYLPQTTVDQLKQDLAGWGLELTKVTIGDLDIDQAILKAREEVFGAKRKKDAAFLKAEIMAQEVMGSVIQAMAITYGMTPEAVQQKIAASSKLQKEFRERIDDLLKRQMAINGRSFTHIHVDGAQGMEKGLLELIALFKTNLSHGGVAPNFDKKTGEKKTKTKKFKIFGKDYQAEVDDEEGVQSWGEVS